MKGHPRKGAELLSELTAAFRSLSATERRETLAALRELAASLPGPEASPDRVFPCNHQDSSASL